MQEQSQSAVFLRIVSSNAGQALDSALVTADHPQVSELLNLRIYVSTDGTVFKQDVADLGIGSSSGSKSKVNSKRRKEQLQSCTKTESTPPKPIVKKVSAAATEEGYSVVNTPHEESFEVTPGLATNSIPLGWLVAIKDRWCT